MVAMAVVAAKADMTQAGIISFGRTGEVEDRTTIKDILDQTTDRVIRGLRRRISVGKVVGSLLILDLRVSVEAFRRRRRQHISQVGLLRTATMAVITTTPTRIILQGVDIIIKVVGMVTEDELSAQ